MDADATQDSDTALGSDSERGRSAGSKAQLTPFRKGDPRASIAGKRSAEMRRQRRELTRSSNAEPTALLRAIVATFEREALGETAAAVAMWTMGEVVAGRVKVRDPAAWVRVLVDIARLEAGMATDVTVTVRGDAVARVMALRDAARDVIDVDSDDDPPSSDLDEHP